MKMRIAIVTSAIALAAGAVTAQQKPAAAKAPAGQGTASSGIGVPQFQYDKTWPKALPNQMKVGQVVGVAVDSRNHIWIVQRPKSEPGFMLAREEGPGRRVRYTTRSYAADKPEGSRY